MAKASSTRAKTRGANLDVPQSDAAAEQLVARIGVLQREQAAADAAHDNRIALMEENHATAKKERTTEIAGLTEGVKIWAEANRDRLTNGGRTKTVQLTTGELSWRFGTASVTHRGLKADEVIATIKGLCDARYAEALKAQREGHYEAHATLMDEHRAFGSFLRTKVTLDKDAMHTGRHLAEKIPGVSFAEPGESFDIVPLASQIGEVA